MPQNYDELIRALRAPRPTVLTECDLIERLQGPHVYSTLRDGFKTPIEWLKETSDSLIFNGIPYQGRTLDDVELTRTPLDNGERRTQDVWLEEREDGYTLPDSELLFQLMRRLYQLRQDPIYAPIVAQAREQFRQLFDGVWTITATAIDYNGTNTQATIRKRSPLTGETQHTINIPVTEEHYRVLAHEQPSRQYPNNTTIPENLQPVLEHVFGEGYEQAPDIFKYFSSHRTNEENERVTREVRFWAPNQQGRRNHPARVLSLGVNSYDYFYVSAYDYVNYDGPALGVRSAREE